MTKNEYRQLCLDKLRSLPDGALQAAGSQIWPLLFGWALWQKADAVLAYSSLPDEIDSSSLIQHSLQQGKCVFLPVIEGQTMSFRQIFDTENLMQHEWGFHQAKDDAPLFQADAFNCALLIAPAVAADRQGHRLGRGKGFYDRYLAQWGQRLHTVVAIREDFLLDFPADAFDIPFQYILCEKGLIKSL